MLEVELKPLQTLAKERALPIPHSSRANLSIQLEGAPVLLLFVKHQHKGTNMHTLLTYIPVDNHHTHLLLLVIPAFPYGMRT